MAQLYQFDQIYQQHYRTIFRICKGYFNGDDALAADVTQEVFVKVWQHLPSFRQEAKLSTWIYRITVNTCLIQLRKSVSKKEIHSDNLPEVVSEQYNTEQDERIKKLYACIQKLDASNRAVILMILENVSSEDIAAIVGISVDTLRVRIHRIKKQLSICVKL